MQHLYVCHCGNVVKQHYPNPRMQIECKQSVNHKPVYALVETKYISELLSTDWCHDVILTLVSGAETPPPVMEAAAN